jgi:acyl carrier protein
MDVTISEIKEILKEAISELNEQLDEDEKVEFNENTHFVGSSAAVDSITFVTLISIIEELIEDKLNTTISLVNEKAFSQKHSPFYSIETFSNYIQELLKEI